MLHLLLRHDSMLVFHWSLSVFKSALRILVWRNELSMYNVLHLSCIYVSAHGKFHETANLVHNIVLCVNVIMRCKVRVYIKVVTVSC